MHILNRIRKAWRLLLTRQHRPNPRARSVEFLETRCVLSGTGLGGGGGHHPLVDQPHSIFDGGFRPSQDARMLDGHFEEPGPRGGGGEPFFGSSHPPFFSTAPERIVAPDTRGPHLSNSANHGLSDNERSLDLVRLASTSVLVDALLDSGLDLLQTENLSFGSDAVFTSLDWHWKQRSSDEGIVDWSDSPWLGRHADGSSKYAALNTDDRFCLDSRLASKVADDMLELELSGSSVHSKRKLSKARLVSRLSSSSDRIAESVAPASQSTATRAGVPNGKPEDWSGETAHRFASQTIDVFDGLIELLAADVNEIQKCISPEGHLPTAISTTFEPMPLEAAIEVFQAAERSLVEESTSAGSSNSPAGDAASAVQSAVMSIQQP